VIEGQRRLPSKTDIVYWNKPIDRYRIVLQRITRNRILSPSELAETVGRLRSNLRRRGGFPIGRKAPWHTDCEIVGMYQGRPAICRHTQPESFRAALSFIKRSEKQPIELILLRSFYHANNH
jgi:hypothetical protein